MAPTASYPVRTTPSPVWRGRCAYRVLVLVFTLLSGNDEQHGNHAAGGYQH